MEKFTTRNNYHAKVIAEVFDQSLSDADAMLVMALLHEYCFHLPGPILRDATSVQSFSALTQRDAGTCLARIWRGTDNPRASYAHWYHAWNGEWGSYGRLESLTRAERQRMSELKQQIETHPAVTELIPEDWDIIRGEA